MPANTKKTLSLVLGSGGARGLTHIGIINELITSGFQIDSISGCSIGALVGGIFAAEKLDEFERWIRAVTKVDIVNLLDLSWGKDGFVKGDKIIGTLTELVGDQKIESLSTKFTAVAADIGHEKEVWISSGPLFEAIRASISLPLFFTPVRYKDTWLIDGGILNPVPIAPTFSDGTDLTIAVNLGGPAVATIKSKGRAEAAEQQKSGISATISSFIDKLGIADKNAQAQNLSAYNIANQAFDSMQNSIARQKLAAYPPDYTIEIPRNICGTLEFDRGAEMIALGREKARECITQIEQE